MSASAGTILLSPPNNVGTNLQERGLFLIRCAGPRNIAITLQERHRQGQDEDTTTTHALGGIAIVISLRPLG